VTDAIYRLGSSTGPRLARGSVEDGPTELLPAGLTLGGLLARGGPGLHAALDVPGSGVAPPAARVLAPIDEQEVWCTGLTYERTHEARMATVPEARLYDQLYEADRPELFFKAAGGRVRGPGDPVGIRGDSTWDMAEAEVGIVIAADGRVEGYVIGDDLTSRDIERQNPLYLPQAKVYDGSCALGPAIVPAAAARPPFDIRMVIQRDGSTVFEGATSTARMVRSFADLATWLCRAVDVSSGVFLLTGCGIVPDPELTLRAGDRIRIEIGPLGVLENIVEVVGADGPTTGGAAKGRA
jgi:2-dehydro-3-deoxy-D-arabinonate dehydratase